MIRVPDRALPQNILSDLAKYQEEVDAEGTFPEKVTKAKSSFRAANTKGNGTFDAIKSELDQMCAGARRCMYCEDSAADEVEHFRPKAFYPEVTFSWENYLYACGICNAAKRERFAILAPSGTTIYLTRQPKQTPVPPPVGTPLPFDPRSEDAFSWLMLDIAGGTFAIAPVPDLDAVLKARADYTIWLLSLNRDVLIRARREAFESYMSRLHEYIVRRDSGVPASQLNQLVKSIKGMQHPTVWQEICRQSQKIVLLKDLFDEAPEALGW